MRRNLTILRIALDAPSPLTLNKAQRNLSGLASHEDTSCGELKRCAH
jgi:hypothetical protein